MGMDQIVSSQRSAPPDDVADDRQTLRTCADSPGFVHRKYTIVLVLAVLIAYGPLLLTDQRLWDDWTLVLLARSGDLWELFKQLGRRDQFPLVQPLATYGTARDCTAVVLLLSAAIGPVIYAIVRRATAWPPVDAFWAALLTVLVPLNQARFFISTAPYAFSSLFFVLALFLLLLDLDKPSFGRRVLILLLLFLAFSTNSFLVMGWIAPALVLLHEWRMSKNSTSVRDRINAAIRSIAARSELLLAPPAYWLAKKTFQPAYGLFAQYNSFKMDPVTALGRTVTTLFAQVGIDTTLLLPNRFDAATLLLPKGFDLLEIAIAVALIVALTIAIVRIWHVPLVASSEQRGDRPGLERWIAVIAAFTLCISALFPYVMVGNPPRFSGLWETRHQTTLMLVSGFTIVAIYRLLFPRRFFARAAVVTAIGFLVLDFSFMHRMLADILETRQIADHFRREVPPSGTMMYVVENDRTYRTFGRFFPFYELAWLVRTGPGSGPVMPQSNQEFINPSAGDYAQELTPKVVATLVDLCKKFRGHPEYGFGDFVSNGQIETVTLTAIRPRPGPFETAYLTIRDLGHAEPRPSEPQMVRVDSKSAPIGGACRSPCCGDD